MNNAEKTPQWPIHSGFGAKTTAKQVLKKINLTGKTAIVTGGYSGIGLETTKALSGAGATIIVPARNAEKTKAALSGIANVELESLDLLDQKSIDTFAERFLASGRPLHILINNAGIMAPPLIRDARGYESQFATNHLGHFQLTARLFPALKKAGSARVVAVSSRAQRIGGVNFDDFNFENTPYDKWKAYAQSKSANVLFSVELDRLAKDYGVRAFSVHPGLIPTTDLGRFRAAEKTSAFVAKSPDKKVLKIINRFNLIILVNMAMKIRSLITRTPADVFKTISRGAATSVWCATSEKLSGMGGVYCEDCDIAEAVPGDSNKGYGVRPWAIDPAAAEKLWNLSEKLTGVKFIF
jgi:NAD(P)-dependent dehydrogenase (short-subunit alcohol dehydrogenase family)